jgi:asparagine synthase (glutamine-hydrolysing)
MCGFIGEISKKDGDLDFLDICNENLVCRGPDEKKSLNTTTPNGFNLNMIFNRLAILDLTKQGSQPMKNIQNDILMFNGEIFNHVELRKQLEDDGVKFFSNNSDSEVILNGLSHYGINFIEKLIGQFAIFFYSNSNNTGYLVRDRLAQKPLFYSFEKNSLKFSSNLKSLIQLNKTYTLDEDSLYEYMYTGVVRSPNTIISNIKKLRPGELIEINLDDNISLNKDRYWSPNNYIDNREFDEKIFLDLLIDSYSIRSKADVEISNLLSGGIDSTALIKINEISKNRSTQNTFSVSIKDSEYDESFWFSQVVEKYKTNHKTEIIPKDISLNIVNDSINLFDEPYADPSTVPSYIIYKTISNYYKVAISGDGGDELLGGYTRIYNSLNRKKLNENLLKFLFKIFPYFLGTGYFKKSYISNFHDKKISSLFKKNNNFKINFETVSNSEYKTAILFEYCYYLPEMMMLKVDRTSMASSIEVRSPYVDHRLVEYILSTNLKYKSTEDAKQILKNLIADDMGQKFINRKKQGFVFDIKDWVFQNSKIILYEVINSEVHNFVKIDKFKRLFYFKSRTNALRIWKIYFLSIYLKSLKNL